MSSMYPRASGPLPPPEVPSTGGLGKVLAVTAIVVIAVGAVVVAAYFTLTPSADDDPRAKQDLHFRCTKCGRELDINVREYSAWASENKPEILERYHCPNCHAKLSCVLMMTCQSCGEHFTAKEARQAAVEKAGETPYACPHCGADIGGTTDLGQKPRREPEE